MGVKRIVVRKIITILFVCSLPAAAEMVELDGIIAVVDDDVVLKSELIGRLDTIIESMQAQGMQSAPDREAIFSQLMERLILESIQLQMAEKRGIIIDDEELTGAVRQFADANEMTLEAFTRVIEADGMTYRQFREEIRREMILNRIQRGMVNRRIVMSDQDIEDVIASPFFLELTSDAFRVGHILIAVGNNSDRGAAAAASQEAREIVRLLREGADFAQMAVERSAGSTALEGGDLGWRSASELPSLFAEQIIAMQPGETADPVRNSLGFHVVQLLEKRGVSESQQQALARHVLVRPSAIRTPEETRLLIEELWQRVLDGEDFGEIAKEYSEDPGSALAGGELGWSSGEEFVPEFRAALARLDVGEISEPFESQFGWHFMQVVDRRDMDMTDETRRDMAVRFLHNRRFEEELQLWLKEIRDEAFVQIRDRDDAEQDGG
ncbi:MAG: peptidylprolyl isomerase [Gammaproteobacteria bacterium]|nr:peptidylprolyl isomerase [Gammaproteobacteria bacterium]